MKIAIKSCFTTLVEDTTLIQNAATPYPVEFALPAANWSGGAQTVAHASLLADSNYIHLVGADAGTRNVYDSYGVSADNVTTSGQMTFRCDMTPTVDLSVFIIRLEVGTDE